MPPILGEGDTLIEISLSDFSTFFEFAIAISTNFCAYAYLSMQKLKQGTRNEPTTDEQIHENQELKNYREYSCISKSYM